MNTSFKTLRLAAVLGIALHVAAATAQEVDCKVDPCSILDTNGSCDARAVESLNERCGEWNAAIKMGRLPTQEPTQKPNAGFVRQRVKTFNNCVAAQVRKNVPKHEAIAVCQDALAP